MNLPISKLYYRLSLLCYALFGMIALSFAQSADERVFEFGEVSPDEFLLTAQGADTTVEALSIFDVGHCDFRITNNRGFTYVFRRHVRYKILNKNGYSLANLSIPLYHASSGGGKENIVSVNAATYNLENGEIVESKLDKDAKFVESLDKNYTVRKYVLPNVKEGSIIEFRYTIESDFIFNLRGWSFQRNIPVLWSEYNVRVPEYFNYKVNLRGYWPVEEQVKKRENANYAQGVISSAEYTKYVARDVPALKDEPYVTTMDDYRASIEFELQGTRFPDEGYKDYTGTWPKIIKALMEADNFGKYVNRRAQNKAILEEIRLDEADEMAKVSRIYRYVQNRVKWNNEYSLYAAHQSPKVLFEKHDGNSSDINLALIGLLRAAGIMAYPVLVSTRENGEHPGYPVISKFNNVVALVAIDSTTLFLDACDQLMPINMLSFQNLSHQGFLFDIDTQEGQWIPIEPTAAGESSYLYNLTLNADRSLTGNITEIHKGYNALSRRDRYRSKSNETEYLKGYKEDRAGLDVLAYEIVNIDSIDKPLTEKFDVIINDHVEEAGNLIYFSPMLYERTKENIFKYDERKFPVDFGHAMKESFKIILRFPMDYSIEKLPQSVRYRLPDDSGDFTISYHTEGNVVLVSSVINLKKDNYSADDYFDLKELFSIITKRQAEQIVFKKI